MRFGVLSLLVLGFLCSAGYCQQLEPIARIQEIEVNVDNETNPLIENDYYISKAKHVVTVIVENPTNSSCSFGLYTLDGAYNEILRDSCTLTAGAYQSLNYWVMEVSPSGPYELDGIRVKRLWNGSLSTLIDVDYDDFSGMNITPGITGAGWDVTQGWSLGGTVFDKRIAVSWGRPLLWPEPESEKYQIVTWPLGENLPLHGEDMEYADNPGETTGAWVFSEIKRSSGSWGLRHVYLDFPIQRCQLRPDPNAEEGAPYVWMGHASLVHVSEGLFSNIYDISCEEDVTQAQLP